MARLGLILIFVLHFEAGVSAGPFSLYSRPGQDVALPCPTTSPSDALCFFNSWFYSRDPSQSVIEVGNGFVSMSSGRAARLSVGADCSLVVQEVTAEDAGLYTCRRGGDISLDVSVLLHILTISPSPPAAGDAGRDGEVTLRCSLLTYNSVLPCGEKSFRWVDETGTVLLDDGFGNSFLSESGCVSSFTVKRQSGGSRKYTCKLVENNNVLTEVDYTPDTPGDISAEPIFLYSRPGQDAVLPCSTAAPSDPTCSTVSWFFLRNEEQIFIEVQSGNVVKSSGRAARLGLDSDCSLIINTVTAEDVGLYSCQRTNTKQDVDVYLSVLTMSPSPPDAEPQSGGEVTLVCWLLVDSDLGLCPTTFLRWVDETGAVLPGEAFGNCVSVMSLQHQSGNNKRYTCQVVGNNNILIEAEYTPQFTGSTVSAGWSPLSCLMLALRIAGLIMLTVITVLLIRNRRILKPLDNGNNVNNDVQYENVEARPAAVQLQ